MDRGVASLRRRLDAAGYAEAVEGISVALVERLLGDLLRAQDGFRGVKMQAVERGNELSTADHKV
jgi:hypothetical protein